MRQASGLAREGAGTIGAAQRRVIYAVQDAHNAGFNVEEDLLEAAQRFLFGRNMSQPLVGGRVQVLGQLGRDSRLTLKPASISRDERRQSAT